MKKYFIFATALAALASCSSDDFVGESPNGVNGQIDGAISFNMNTPRVTRATIEADANKLNRNFVVFGYKTVGGTPSIVFNNYQAKWVSNTAGSTESNSANWEYVGYKNLPVGVTSNVGVTAFSALTGSGQANETAIDQSIKYWDFAATSYDFFAYSLGTGTGVTPTYATSSPMTNSTYTLTGSQAELGACYISKKEHISSLSSSSTEVDLTFMNFLSKIQLGFYENIPGYSVKDIKFYIDANTKSTGDAANDGKKPAIYGGTNSIPTGGTYTITFDANYDPVVTLNSASTSDSKVEFDAVSTGPNVWLSDYAARDYKEAEETIYLGRTASAATTTKQMTVLPNLTGATLTLKVDYTLVSRDGSTETIQVNGATATIPTAYTQWKPNYAYTYIFKISDNTDGHIGAVEGLYPITFDAVVTDSEDGTQTTITTVDPISITTYQNGAIANEYNAGNIYVVVGDGSTVLTAGTNAKLYTATIESGAAQGLDKDGKVAITEEMVANALTKSADGSGNYVLTDANEKKLTVTPVAGEAADKLTGGLTAIPAVDAPGGKELTINCASFAAANNTVYVFEYLHNYTENEVNAYNAGLAGALNATTPLTEDQTTAYNAAMSASKATGATLTAEEAAAYNATLTGHISTSDTHKHYKVIKVGTPTAIGS